MARWEQYEVWVQKGAKWEMIGAFNDFYVAAAMARNRSSRMRLIHATYEDNRRVAEDILAELGNTRTGTG
jgi:hypothetical protein